MSAEPLRPAQPPEPTAYDGYLSDAMVRDFIGRAADMEAWRIRRWLSFCESPIEAALAAHLALTPVSTWPGTRLLSALPDTRAGGDRIAWGAVPFAMDATRFGSDAPVYEVWAQQPVDRYRLDFLAIYKPANRRKPKFVAVECDGHDFHERTRAQAERDRSRDRDMAMHGYGVLRFTGSEIARDAVACAAQVAEQLRQYEISGER